MKPALIAVMMLAALVPACAAASEWDDYLSGEFQNFVWDEEVRAGYEAYAKEEYETAAASLVKAIDKGCKDPVVVFRAGYALRASGEADKAAEAAGKAAGYFKVAAELFAKARTDHHYRAEAHYYLADFYVAHAKYDEAQWELEHALELREDFTEAYLLYGDLFAAQGKYHFAAEKYAVAHEKDPENIKPLLNLTVALYRDGQLDAAKAALEKARALEPESERLGLMAATLALASDDLAGAAKEYALVVEHHPASIEGLLGLGKVAWRQGKLDEAAAHYAAILALDPAHVGALYGLGISKAKLGKIDEAIGHLERAIELEPTHKNAHYNLGTFYQSKGEHEKAIEQYAQVMKLDPNDRTPTYNLGVIFIRLKRYPEAQTYLEQAVEAFGKDSRWGRASQKMLDLVIEIRRDRPVQIEKELEKLDQPETPGDGQTDG